jgi:hypothetical protein
MSTQDTPATGLSGDPDALAAAGNIAWRAGDPATATLAWERALLLDPRQKAADAGLAVAAHEGVRSPAHGPCETYASVLTADAWTVLASLAFWVAVLLLAAPRLFSVKQRDRHHAIAGFAAAILLLTVPGLIGSNILAKRGVIQKADTQVMLTPTATGEPLGSLAAGERVRLIGRHGDYRRVRTADNTEGWIAADKLTPLTPGG